MVLSALPMCSQLGYIYSLAFPWVHSLATYILCPSHEFTVWLHIFTTLPMSSQFGFIYSPPYSWLYCLATYIHHHTHEFTVWLHIYSPPYSWLYCLVTYIHHPTHEFTVWLYIFTTIPMSLLFGFIYSPFYQCAHSLATYIRCPTHVLTLWLHIYSVPYPWVHSLATYIHHPILEITYIWLHVSSHRLDVSLHHLWCIVACTYDYTCLSWMSSYLYLHCQATVPFQTFWQIILRSNKKYVWFISPDLPYSLIFILTASVSLVIHSCVSKRWFTG